jgi:hypothetical protein
MEWNGMEWNGMEVNIIEQNRLEDMGVMRGMDSRENCI